MTLTDIDVIRLRKILWEIKRETHGKHRGIFIDNKVDQASLLLRKAERKYKRIKSTNYGQD